MNSDSETSTLRGKEETHTTHQSNDGVHAKFTRNKISRTRRSRSLYGVNPSSQLGPKASLCQGQTLTIQDPSSQRLQWCKPPMSVLVIRKPGDCDIAAPYKNVVTFLAEKDLKVYVEEGTIADLDLSSNIVNNITQFNIDDCLSDKVDFIVTLGGDGTLIHASSLFQQSVPPILAFNMGSLGFLTPFDCDSMKTSIESALAGNVGLTLRSRLKCVMATKDQSDNLVHIKELENGHSKKYKELTSYSVVNEVVVDRGPSPYLCHIDLFVDRQHITSVQGDGLIISTPTGSTAYATAAGASMMHPSVPAILIVPICAHSLSFRPIVLPAGVEITIKLSPGARNTAWAAFDGRNRTEITHDISLRITTSIYPLPSICAQGQLEDWFSSLAECLHWNVRRPQKSLKSGSSTLSTASSVSSLSLNEDSSTD